MPYTCWMSAAEALDLRKSAHDKNISKPLGWRVFAGWLGSLLFLATGKSPSPVASSDSNPMAQEVLIKQSFGYQQE